MSLLLIILVPKNVFPVVNLVQKLLTKKKKKKYVWNLDIFKNMHRKVSHYTTKMVLYSIYNWETYWLMRTIHTIETYF